MFIISVDVLLMHLKLNSQFSIPLEWTKNKDSSHNLHFTKKINYPSCFSAVLSTDSKSEGKFGF